MWRARLPKVFCVFIKHADFSVRGAPSAAAGASFVGGLRMTFRRFGTMAAGTTAAGTMAVLSGATRVELVAVLAVELAPGLMVEVFAPAECSAPHVAAAVAPAVAVAGTVPPSCDSAASRSALRGSTASGGTSSTSRAGGLGGCGGRVGSAVPGPSSLPGGGSLAASVESGTGELLLGGRLSLRGGGGGGCSIGAEATSALWSACVSSPLEGVCDGCAAASSDDDDDLPPPPLFFLSCAGGESCTAAMQSGRPSSRARSSGLGA